MYRSRNIAEFVSLAAALAVLAVPQAAFALPSWVGDFSARYPSATNLADCGTCHSSFTTGQGLNDYGAALSQNNPFTDVNAAMAAIEGDDSDGDGETNLTEIMNASGFEPGWDCDSYESALNAPGDLADYVDVNDIGCLGVTTTVTMPPTTITTTTTTTSTTLGTALCGQPISTGPMPTATDCLFILNAAVGVTTCTPECICAPTGTLPISATDALVCLNKSVGQDVPLNCPC